MNNGLFFGLATNLQQRMAAFRLLYKAYLSAGLIEPNPHYMRVTPHHLLDTTNTLIVLNDNDVVCTLSLVIDGDLGLPMESIYGDVVAEWRDQGCLAEATCLAQDGKQRRSTTHQLMCLLIQLACRSGVHHLLIVVHPKHVEFYEDYLGFEIIADERLYPTVRNNPAVPLRLDLQLLTTNERIFDVDYPEQDMQANPLTLDELDYLQKYTE